MFGADGTRRLAAALAAVGQGEEQFFRAIVVFAVNGDFGRPDIELRRQLLPQLAGQIRHLLPGVGPFFKDPFADLRSPIRPLVVLEHPGLKLFGGLVEERRITLLYSDNLECGN